MSLFFKSDVQSWTPSRKDGIDMATETRYRKEDAKLIITTGVPVFCTICVFYTVQSIAFAFEHL